MTTPETADIEFRGKTFTVALHTKFDRAFWLKHLPNWERGTFDFLDAHVEPGSVFLDIGSWIGPIGLYAAARGARVIALEPDPVSIVSLTDNAALNNAALPGSLEVLNSGFDAKPGTITIYGNHKGFGTSGSSSTGRGLRSVSLPTTTAEDLISMVGDQRPVVIKVDIEGHEFFCAEALAGLRRALDATLVMSLHPSFYRRSFGWRSWFGRGNDKVAEGIQALVEAFSDAAVSTEEAPHGLSPPELAARLQPIDGEIPAFTLVARPS